MARERDDKRGYIYKCTKEESDGFLQKKIDSQIRYNIYSSSGEFGSLFGEKEIAFDFINDKLRRFF